MTVHKLTLENRDKKTIKKLKFNILLSHDNIEVLEKIL